jgi:hypothetical protein
MFVIMENIVKRPVFVIDTNRPCNYRPMFGMNCCRLTGSYSWRQYSKTCRICPRNFGTQYWCTTRHTSKTWLPYSRARRQSPCVSYCILYCQMVRMALDSTNCSVLQPCLLFQSEKCPSVHTVWTTLESTRKLESMLIYCKWKEHYHLTCAGANK